MNTEFLVKWEKPNPLQIDSYATGKKIVYATTLHDGIAFEVTDGHKTWRGHTPFPWATPTQPAMEPIDSAMLDFISDEYLDLRCFDIPTGAGDADVGWKLIAHHMGKPHEREVAITYMDDPRAAIRDAMKRGAK